MAQKFESLFTPYQIGKLTVKNRFAVAPMGIVPWANGAEYTPDGIHYVVERAKGGFGLIFCGAMTSDVDIDPFSTAQLITPRYNPAAFVKSAASMNERVHTYDTKIFAQVTMGFGRNYPGFYAPSEKPVFFDPSKTARALTIDQIKKKIEYMVESAAIVKQAGFDGIELHAMHWGYLLDCFAMSLTNDRTDEYGGCLENRMRCARETIQGIKQVCGSDFPVSMRLGLKSYVKGLGFGQCSLSGEEEAGRTLEEGIRICQMLEAYGCDVLNCDAGIYESFPIALAPSYLPKGEIANLTAEARKAVKVPVLACGRMDDPEMAERAITEGKADGIVLGRASLADPFFPQKVEMGRPEKIRPCIACNQACIGKSFTDGGAGCAVNPQATRELSYGLRPALQKKKIVVVGGGVSGMEAARTATLRGHDVTLYEASGNLGGALEIAGAHAFKKDIKRLNSWYCRELEELGICVKLGERVDAEAIKASGADAVVLAVGSQPVIPKVPGMDNPKTVLYTDALRGKAPIGQRVVVVGGGLVGCEIALEYAMQGKEVSVVEMLSSILSAGPTVPVMNSMAIHTLFADYGVKVYTESKLEQINDNGAVVSATSGESRITEIAGDTVVIAIGFKSAPSMAKDLLGCGMEVYEVGDGHRTGNVMTSVWDAYEVARSL